MADLFTRAQAVIPGGVDSPVRAFGSVGGAPVFVERASGPHIYSADREYIDLVGSWGPALLGHAHPTVVEAVQKAASKGLSFGAPTEAEVELAELVIDRVEPVEKIRFVSTGTEATMTAIRLARGFTGRDLVVKFAGCYHGHEDNMLVAAGSGVATFGMSSSAGVPKGTVEDTVVLPYNNREAVETLFATHGEKIAAIITEGAPANMGVVPPTPGFNAFLKEQCEKAGALLILDEVLTGFRLSKAGMWGIDQDVPYTPDLLTFGKVIGGGMPIAALGGRADVMDWLAPLGPVYQAGTLSGNPLATAAGITTLALADDAVYACRPPPPPPPPAARAAGGARRDGAVSAGEPFVPSTVRWLFPGTVGRGRGPHNPAGRFPVLNLVFGHPGNKLRRGRRTGPVPVCPVLPFASRGRHSPASFGVRGLLRIRHPHRRGHRQDPRRSTQGGSRRRTGNRVVSLTDLASLLSDGDVVVVSGAGLCETDSGLPDYRGSGGSEKPSVDYDMFVGLDMWQRWVWQRNQESWKALDTLPPTTGHRILADWERRGIVTGTATQNIDGMHFKAGSKKVAEMHGSFTRVTCIDCNQVTPRSELDPRLRELNPLTVDDPTQLTRLFLPRPTEHLLRSRHLFPHRAQTAVEFSSPTSCSSGRASKRSTRPSTTPGKPKQSSCSDHPCWS